MAFGGFILLGIPLPEITGIGGRHAEGYARAFGIVPLLLGAIAIISIFSRSQPQEPVS